MGQQTSSSSQPPQRPPPSRRTSSNIIRDGRKRSLEFPGLTAPLSNQSNPQPSNAIPIPFMAATVYQQPPSPPHSRPHYFPPSSTKVHPPPRNPPPPQTNPVPPTPPVVKDDTLLVRSRLPAGLPTPQPPPDSDPESEEPVGTQEATITWRGPAKEVYLTGIAERPYRVRMHHEPGSKSTFFTTLRLPPGNHPLRFIVDDQPKCTDTLPTATDPDGTLINYIEIPSPTHSPSRSRSNTSDAWHDGSGSVLAGGPDAQGSSSSSRGFTEMDWTCEIPPRLFKLAAEEEAYLAARAAAAQNPVQRNQQYTPLPPPPPVPYPPSLPRHLEKVILNNSSARNPNSSTSTPAILSSASNSRPRIIGTGTTGPLIPAGPRPRGGHPVTSNPPGIGAPFTGHLSPPPGILSSASDGFGDDSSVLPVPNHVVLNHLGTSAIKNGVLAVGTTMRYHHKYISTIYYKPI
ncbi:hypothetical protein FRB99_007200 [Tulasnella sp. 403]|nr:hypothetical protein FRB99_007200 [Tulasnella sp. 403]